VCNSSVGPPPGPHGTTWTLGSGSPCWISCITAPPAPSRLGFMAAACNGRFPVADFALTSPPARVRVLVTTAHGSPPPPHSADLGLICTRHVLSAHGTSYLHTPRLICTRHVLSAHATSYLHTPRTRACQDAHCLGCGGAVGIPGSGGVHGRESGRCFDSLDVGTCTRRGVSFTLYASTLPSTLPSHEHHRRTCFDQARDGPCRCV
jgi:hypothetical protein